MTHPVRSEVELAADFIVRGLTVGTLTVRTVGELVALADMFNVPVRALTAARDRHLRYGWLPPRQQPATLRGLPDPALRRGRRLRLVENEGA